jgi:hypothetical protein
MAMEMFVNRILMLMAGTLTSHAVYEMLEIEHNSVDAIATYEAVVNGNIL